MVSTSGNDDLRIYGQGRPHFPAHWQLIALVITSGIIHFQSMTHQVAAVTVGKIQDFKAVFVNLDDLSENCH